MKKTILFIFLLFSVQIILPQSVFRQGFIISNTGDTVFGLVKYSEGFDAFRYCEFRKTADEDIEKFLPDKLAGYGFREDKYFESKETLTEDKSKEKAFFELITKGLVSLYRLENDFYIQKGDSAFYKLTIEERETIVDGKRMITSYKKYIGYLRLLLADCPAITNRITGINLSEKSLTELIEDYNREMTGTSESYKSKKPWIKLTVGISGGAGFSFLSFNGAENPYEHLGGHFNVSGAPQAGLSFDLISPRHNERLSLHGDLIFTKTEYYSYSEIITSGYTDRHFVTIGLTQLKTPVGLRYTFPEKRMTPFFSFGILSILHLKSESSWLKETDSGGVITPVKTEAFEISKDQLGLWGSAGIAWPLGKNISSFTEIRIDRSYRLAPILVDSKSTINSIQLCLGLKTR